MRIMNGINIHPRSSLTRSATGLGRKGKKVLREIRSRSLSSTFSQWGGRADKGEKSKRCCACPESESSSYCSESSSEHPEFNAPFSMLHNVTSSSRRKPPRIKRKWIFGSVLDPQSTSIKRTNRMFLLACSLGMFIDPLFLDTLTIDEKLSCLYVNNRYAALVTILRSMIDAMYLWHIWLQLKLAYVSKKSLVLGRGDLVWDARDIALHYLCAFGGFVFDLFVILPIPQIMLWVVVPYIMRQGEEVTDIMTYVLIAFLFQYIPKVFHLFLIIRRMQRVTGYVFGTAWWGFGLNLVCYMIAAHVAGSCWYVLGIQRVEECLQSHCKNTTDCSLTYLGCPNPIALPGSQPSTDLSLAWGQSSSASRCLSSTSDYTWGIFRWVVPLVKGTNGLEKIVFPLFWGIMTLSSFGNALTPSNHLVEASFCVVVVSCGLLLFTMLIGNIQVFLHSYTSNKEAMQLKMRDLEWWMRRRQLPSSVRQRVRQSERQKWAATRGVDEAAMISELPEGLRRDIKRHLCVDLVRRVPLFDQMDDLVVNNICDRLKPFLFIKGETIVNEGDPVLRMVFVVRGFVQSAYRMTNGDTSSCVLGPGNFSGDELVTWCFRKSAFDRFPTSNATLTTLSNVELFGFDARDLRYIIEHFRYKFINEKLKNTARYWSSNWRTWAAVTIQLAWRRFKKQREERREWEKSGPIHGAPFVPNAEPFTTRTSLTMNETERLRMYTAMFCSPKPQDHLE